jgi:5,10-methylenetetrahydromethanopterin reductase
MGKVKIGISFDGFATFGDALAIAREAESAGASSLWMAEHLGYRDPLVSCLAFLQATRAATVVPTAISPYLRNPLPLAMAMATLAEAAPGRVELAVGVGNPLFLAEAGVAIEKPVKAMREYVEAMRGLWSGEAQHMPEALLHKLAGARMAFKPPQPIPIWLAPMKEQMLRLTGRIGDGVVLSGGLSPEFSRHSIGLVKKAAADAGRDPASIRTSSYIFFLAGADERTAMERVRRKLAFVLRNRFIDDNIRFSGIPIDQDAIIAAISRRDIDAAAREVPDEAVEAFSVWGSRQRCATQLERYIAAGIEEPVLLLAGEASDRRESLAAIREFAGV